MGDRCGGDGFTHERREHASDRLKTAHLEWLVHTQCRVKKKIDEAGRRKAESRYNRCFKFISVSL